MQSNNGLTSLNILLLDQNIEITEDFLNTFKHFSGFGIIQEHLDHNFKFSFIGIKSFVIFCLKANQGLLMNSFSRKPRNVSHILRFVMKY